MLQVILEHFTVFHPFNLEPLILISHYIWISVQGIFTKRPFNHFTLLNIILRKLNTPCSTFPFQQSPKKLERGRTKAAGKVQDAELICFLVPKAWLLSCASDCMSSWAKCGAWLHLMNLRVQSKRQIWYVWKYEVSFSSLKTFGALFFILIKALLYPTMFATETVFQPNIETTKVRVITLFYSLHCPVSLLWHHWRKRKQYLT